MKSVCLLVQNHYDGDIRVRRKAEALVSAGYSVDVLALSSSRSPARDYVLNGVNVHTIALGKKRGSLVRYAFEYLAFFGWALWTLSLRMGRRCYAVVDVNTLPDFLVFAALVAKWRGAKVVLDMHEITPEFYMSKYGVGAKHWQVRLSRAIERRCMAYADQVITINEPIQDLLISRGLLRARSTVIMNAADESLFAAALHPAVSTPGEAHGRFVMMYHGTLTRIYGLDIALEALGLAQKEMPGVELWILGSGPEQRHLEGLAQRLGVQAKFVGAVPPQEIPQWLQRCDIGVLATRQDVFLDFSFSNKLSEYIIMGKAVISSRLKTIRHYFSDQALAYFEPNNPADLAKQMIRLYRDPALRSRLAGKAKVEFTPICWEVMKQRYLRMMDDVVGVERGASNSIQPPGKHPASARPGVVEHQCAAAPGLIADTCQTRAATGFRGRQTRRSVVLRDEVFSTLRGCVQEVLALLPGIGLPHG